MKEGRNWYPTERAAFISPVKIFASGQRDARFKHQEYPYELIVRKEWEGSIPAVQFRIARPTNQLDKFIAFYEEGLGLKRVGEFWNHEGYDGIMFGLPDSQYHLEFTQSKEKMELPQPAKEHLLVFMWETVWRGITLPTGLLLLDIWKQSRKILIGAEAD